MGRLIAHPEERRAPPDGRISGSSPGSNAVCLGPSTTIPATVDDREQRRHASANSRSAGRRARCPAGSPVRRGGEHGKKNPDPNLSQRSSEIRHIWANARAAIGMFVSRGYRSKLLEARVRIELTNKGFADLCLTTWLPRLGNYFHHIAMKTAESVVPNT